MLASTNYHITTSGTVRPRGLNGVLQINDPRERAIAFLMQEHAAIIADDLYEEEGGRLFGELSRANPHYFNFNAERDNVYDNAEAISLQVRDTDTIVIIGGTAAVVDKELVAIDPLLRGDPKRHRRIISIDPAKDFNEACEDAINRKLAELDDKIPGGHNVVQAPRIDRSIFDLTPTDLQFIHQGNVTGFCMGGTPFNPRGKVSDSFPKHQIEQFLSQLALIITNPETTCNHMVIGYNTTTIKKKIELAYTHIPEDDPTASSQYWFANGLAQLLRKTPDIEETNKEEFPDGITAETILERFEQAYEYDQLSSTSKNGLRAKYEFAIVFPGRTPDEHARRITITQGERLVFMNVTHPNAQKLNRLVYDMPAAMESRVQLEDQTSGSRIQIFRAPPQGPRPVLP